MTGRLAFQIAAGPQVALFQIPTNHVEAAAGTAGTPRTRRRRSVLVAEREFAVRRCDARTFYWHTAMASEADRACWQVRRQTLSTDHITRPGVADIFGGITGGYSRNRGLAVVARRTASEADIRLLVWRRQSFISSGPLRWRLHCRTSCNIRLPGQHFVSDRHAARMSSAT